MKKKKITVQQTVKESTEVAQKTVRQTIPTVDKTTCKWKCTCIILGFSLDNMTVNFTWICAINRNWEDHSSFFEITVVYILFITPSEAANTDTHTHNHNSTYRKQNITMLKSYKKNYRALTRGRTTTLASHLWIIYRIYKSKKNILKPSNVINTE